MDIDKKKVDRMIIRAKQRISTMVIEQDKERIGAIEKYNKELCLVIAEFKCQRCENEENLQVHHLIMRKAKLFMDFWRYASQRYYWANVIILCRDCHNFYHNSMGRDNGEEQSLCISKKEIDRIKKKFALKDKNEKEK